MNRTVCLALTSGAISGLTCCILLNCKALVSLAPSAIADIACVIADDEKGESISQIVVDCGGDTAQVISILTDPTNYAKVNGTPAYAETARVKLALSKAP